VVWGIAEVSVTIMAASIPVLRVLFKDIKATTKRKLGQSTSHSANRDKSFNSESRSMARNATVVTSGGSKRVSFSQPYHPEGSLGQNNSEESLVQEKNSSGGILQTQEVAIEYHENKAYTQDVSRMV